LNILKNAKSHCDYLIVGVTTDQEVNRIKNKMPVICFEERKAIIESIRYVDKVIPEDDTDKIKAWTKYKFDVIFKGSDWKGTAKWDEYERQFSKVGVDVFYFTYTKETSSTKLREALDNINNYCDSRIS
jgi:glycerol-3-phosphate cytidylyltransferase